jgi:ankyrin repeat protein
MVEIAEMLIASGYEKCVNEAVNNIAPLFYAIVYNQERMTALLINHKADVNAVYDKGRTPLNVAIDVGALNLAELLINKGANIYHADEQGNSALHHIVKLSASMKEELLIPFITLLISKGARWDVPNKAGMTAKDIAIKMRLGNALQLMK